MQNHDTNNNVAPDLLTSEESTDEMISDNTKVLVQSLYIYIPLLKRIIILALSAAALFVFSQFAQNGRYQVAGYGRLLDTRTGAVYKRDVSESPLADPELVSKPIEEDEE